jgi:hypothetical protein
VTPGPLFRARCAPCGLEVIGTRGIAWRWIREHLGAGFEDAGRDLESELDQEGGDVTSGVHAIHVGRVDEQGDAVPV